jgi:phage gpG-like protein
MSFEIKVDSNAAQAAAQLKAFPAEMAAGLARALDHENELTIGHIQARKLSKRGPDTLGVVTNRFRSSVNRTEATVEGDVITSALGSNVAYAKIHEFGFDGDVEVKAHKRRIIALDRYERKGQRLVQTQSGLPGEIRAHSRHMRMPARAPFKTSLEERGPRYSRSLSAAILAAWNGGSPS